MWFHWTPRKIVQRNRVLEDLRRIYTCLFSLWASLFDYRECKIAFELILFVTRTRFPLV